MREGKRCGTWAVATVVAAALAWSGSPVSAQEEVRLDGREVSIWNLAGEVEVVRGSGPEVVVRVRRGGADGSRLELETGEVGGRNALRVVYPSRSVHYRRDADRRSSSTTTLRVRSDGTFRGEGGERVRVSTREGDLEAWADLRVEVPPGRDVAIYVGLGEMEARELEADLYLDTHSGGVEVSAVRGRVGVDTGSGSVTVRDVEGSVNVDTGSGSVRLAGIRGDRVVVDTGSGRVSGADVVARAVLVDTGSGSVEIDDLDSPDVRVDTGSGGVRLGLLRDVDRLDVDTGSGGVTVELPESAGAELDLDTGSGGIDLDFPVRVRRVERRRVEGTLGDGEGVIRIETGSGGIRLLRR